jgi:hypothetical protein
VVVGVFESSGGYFGGERVVEQDGIGVVDDLMLLSLIPFNRRIIIRHVITSSTYPV